MTYIRFINYQKLLTTMFRTILILSLILSSFGSAWCQFQNPEPGYLFDDTVVPRVDISIDPASLDFILDPSNAQSNEEFEVDFYFTKGNQIDTMLNVGFRLRGNTSRNASKKSFKVSFNSFEKGRNFYGLEKMNLNGEHNDPTILRSKICWDLFKMADVPSSRSSHIALYINGEYRGLYIHIEHIDEEFIQKRFYQSHGNLYKCLWPADLHYMGDDPEEYKENLFGRRTYDLKTNKEQDDYSDLAHFIDVLNNTPGSQFPCEIEKVFDVDNYLKAIAIDELTSNWDGPIVNKNNFYLYFNPADDRFMYIPYDLDNTLGIDWFGVDWTRTDIYEWSSISGEYRPIYERILAVPAYKNRLSYYIDLYTKTYLNEEILEEYTTAKKALLYPHRINDFYANEDYGWSVQDFLDNFDEPLGAHVKYGILDYFSVRESSVNSQLENIETNTFISKANITRFNDQINFEFVIENQEALTAAEFQYSINGGQTEEMPLEFIDGTSQFSFPVSVNGKMEYKIFLSSVSSQTFWPLCGTRNIQLGASPTPDLVINELMSNNISAVMDNFGEFDDWIEIYNNSGQTLIMDQYYLSDKQNNPDRWKLPYLEFYPGEYLIIWADDDEETQGDDHASFGLSKSGEFIGIFDNASNDFAVIDSVSFPSLDVDQSYARIPNAIGPFTVTNNVTFGQNNGTTDTKDIKPLELKIYPNPSSDLVHIDSKNSDSRGEITIINMDGQIVLKRKLTHDLNISHLNPGVYTFILNTKDNIYQTRLIKVI